MSKSSFSFMALVLCALIVFGLGYSVVSWLLPSKRSVCFCTSQVIGWEECL